MGTVVHTCRSRIVREEDPRERPLLRDSPEKFATEYMVASRNSTGSNLVKNTRPHLITS